MKFYYVESHNAGPAATLIGKQTSQQLFGCKRVEALTPGSYEIDVHYKAKKWPDLLQSLQLMLVSLRTVDAFREAGLNGVNFFSQKLRAVESKLLRELPDPNYHWERFSGISMINLFSVYLIA